MKIPPVSLNNYDCRLAGPKLDLVYAYTWQILAFIRHETNSQR